MKNNNSFRPNIVGLEDRAMMSVTPVIAMPVEPMRIELENVFVSSAQPTQTPRAGWDLGTWSKKFTDEAQTGYEIQLEDILISSATGPTAQTREHILLARQVGVPVTPEAESALFRLFGDVNGDGATAKKNHDTKQIQIESWSLGATGSTGYTIQLEDVLISSATGEAATGLTKVGAGTIIFNSVNVDETAGYYQTFLRRDANNGATAGFHRLFGDLNGDSANEAVEGAIAKASLYGRKAGDDKR